MEPAVSVIMSVHNDDAYLEQSIRSIINQSLKDLEFIIVDDASTDNSLEIIQQYATIDHRIKLLKNKRRIGLTRSLNKAIEYAKAKYIARQDADDISLPKRLEIQLAFLKRNPNVGVIGTSCYLINERDEVIGKIIGPGKPDLLRGNPITHGSIMMRKDAFEKVGGYNESFLYSQDFNLWLKISRYYDVRILKEILYIYRIHHTSTGVTHKKQQILFGFISKKNGSGNIKAFYLHLSLIDKFNLSKKFLLLKVRRNLWRTSLGRSFLYLLYEGEKKLGLNWLTQKNERVNPFIFPYRLGCNPIIQLIDVNKRRQIIPKQEILL